jgi:hypothetical protein
MIKSIYGGWLWWCVYLIYDANHDNYILSLYSFLWPSIPFYYHL